IGPECRLAINADWPRVLIGLECRLAVNADWPRVLRVIVRLDDLLRRRPDDPTTRRPDDDHGQRAAKPTATKRAIER
ncbi:MAG: hypothetical protein KDK91_28940, partial [Gammaproteobacteria bacterium]|nr:hypothetical protein [Gammaproteobacteria bacterium]